MIDTDQIELDYSSGYRFSSQSNRWNVIPDLLAEVKRLRELTDKYEFDKALDFILSEVKRMRELAIHQGYTNAESQPKLMRLRHEWLNELKEMIE